MLMIFLKMCTSMPRSRSVIRTGRSVVSRRRSSTSELKQLARTVAVATPFTVIFSTSTKNRFSATFSTPESVRATNGVRVSPMLRKMAASKLYRRITGIPSR